LCAKLLQNQKWGIFASVIYSNISASLLKSAAICASGCAPDKFLKKGGRFPLSFSGGIRLNNSIFGCF
jgi:hypothetical protein